MASGSIFRVVKACTTCVTQEMPHGDGSQGEQEVEELEEFTEAATEPAHTLVGKVRWWTRQFADGPGGHAGLVFAAVGSRVV